MDRPTTKPGGAARSGEVRRLPRILIAEDHDINQMLILAIAQRAGLQATLAANGCEAVEAVEDAARRGRPFELILMDVQMPEMDGLEAARRLRAAGHGPDELPIVALSGDARSEDVRACLKAGMQAHLPKPVRLPELTAVLARFIDIEDATPIPQPQAGPDLHGRYRARKAEILHALDEVPELGPSGEERRRQAAALLHKLAGTAAIFGEAKLGEEAEALEQALLGWSGPGDAVRLSAAIASFRRAA